MFYIGFFSSHQPLAHGKLLKSFYAGRPVSGVVVRSQQLLQRIPHPQLLAGFGHNLAGIILI